jgi:hypothetical protein
MRNQWGEVTDDVYNTEWLLESMAGMKERHAVRITEKLKNKEINKKKGGRGRKMKKGEKKI